MTHAHLKIVMLAALPLVLAPTPGCARNQVDTARPAASGERMSAHSARLVCRGRAAHFTAE